MRRGINIKQEPIRVYLLSVLEYIWVAGLKIRFRQDPSARALTGMDVFVCIKMNLEEAGTGPRN